MKKFFTLICALVGFAGVANAASENDIVPLKHSYVLVCDDLGARPGKGVLFGDDHFLDVTGGTTATNKGKTNLSQVDALGEDGAPLYVTEEIVEKYGEYGEHYNWLRLKNTQDVIAMKPTAGSRIIFFLQGNNKTGKDARFPKLSKNADLSDPLNAAPTADFTEKTVAGFRMDFVVPNDWGENEVLYAGSYNGDMFLSFIIVEALEALGTPSVKVGPQTYADGLWYREVTCKTVKADGFPTIATYTVDGSTPNENSPVYTGPIKCYATQTVKFQAFYDFDGDGKPNKDYICEGADNEANVNFTFDAPSITVDGPNVTITSPYENAINYYTINGGTPTEGSSFTLSESATVAASSWIVNGKYDNFISKATEKDVYVLNAIKEKKTIAVTGGDIVLDEEATNDPANTKGNIYKVENGEISADKMDFFVKNLTLAVLKTGEAYAQYQAPAGQEAYIQMSNTNITFLVPAGQKVKVNVVCSKNACKNIDAADAAEDKLVNGCTPDRQCYVNVSGTNYCLTDAEGNVTNDLKLYPNANKFSFELEGGKYTTTKDEEGNESTTFQAADTYYTFQKYSGTGNILISSIEIEPNGAAGIAIVNAADKTANGAIYNLSGQKVDASFKGIVIMNGKKMIQK